MPQWSGWHPILTPADGVDIVQLMARDDAPPEAAAWLRRCRREHSWACRRIASSVSETAQRPCVAASLATFRSIIDGNTICNAASELIANGSIAWPYLGIQGEQTDNGQAIADVPADGPAADAGLEAGDVITEFDGQKIDSQHTLLDLLFNHQPGDVVDVTVDRNGAVHTFQVTLGERPNITE